MTSKRPFDCKYIWGSRELENQLRKLQTEIRINRGYNLQISDLTHQIAHDISSGNINFDFYAFKFRKNKYTRVGDVNVKLK